ncbi:MAG: ATP-dependent Clp protease ATP-binding subunit [Oscillospiraceae bacterium]|nr:ATP-dependent Clp protease ATP-binding subunit [Oscillospiraceae bacterium]
MRVKFSWATERLLQQAACEARGMGHGYLGSEHLLLAMSRAPETTAGRILQWCGAPYTALAPLLLAQIGQGCPGSSLRQGMTPGAAQVLGIAAQAASDLGGGPLEPVHLLLGVGRLPESGAAQLLQQCGVCLDDIFTDAVASLRRRELDTEKRGIPTRVLDQFGINLLEKAEKMETVIGREAEIAQVIQILCRKNKNNPALIGQPGVGKTAIVEGLAQRMALGHVPEPLRGKRLVSVDVAGMVAGTKYRGEFEERLRDMLAEIQRAGNIILFVDEMHTLVGAGAAEGAIDASNIMKPALGRGQLQLIGATTLEEYRRYIEKDAALARRFRSVQIAEPSQDQTLQILRGLRPGLEQHHRLQITDQALETAVQMAARYLPEHYFPDKALDLVDEGAAIAALEAARGGRERFTRQRAALDRDLGSALQERRLDQAVQLQQKLSRLEQTMPQYTVQPRHVAQAVANRTGIPAGEVQDQERQRLQQLEQLLRERIVGQDQAVHEIAGAVRRGRAGLASHNRPVAAILLMGPTGVGKTALCKALAAVVFGSEKAMIRLDMSEYMEKHAVSRLVGAPPGYVGYEDGGDLTEKVRRNPYSLVLLDELEKAHRDVTGLLLQIFDDGVLTDSTGRRVDFRHTLIVMTSNIGSDQTGKGGLGFCPDSEPARRQAQLESLYPPEFLGRIDCITQFSALGQAELTQIAAMLLRSLQERAAQRQVMLQISPAVAPLLASQSSRERAGARGIRHRLQQEVENPVAEQMLSCSGRPLAIQVTVAEGRVILR